MTLSSILLIATKIQPEVTLEKYCRMCHYFQSHQLMTKKKQNISCLLHQQKHNVNGVNIGESSVRYLGIIINNTLIFQEDIKRMLSRMACSIKTLNNIRNCFLIKTRVTLLNGLVLNHVQYSSLMLLGIRKSLMITLEKQLNWGIKVCFKRKSMIA